MSNFKVGDKVVILNTRVYVDDATIHKGSVGIIVKKHKDRDNVYKVKFDHTTTWLWDYELILLDIYDSPLYKLMNEEE